MKLLAKYLPLGFLVLAWFIFSSPYFIKHRIPYPSEFQVSFFTPWNAYPQYEIPVKNNALSDVVDELYPWKHFTIETVKNGQLPLWNPYSFSGTPHLANYQTAVLSPFNLLFFILPFIDAWSVLILLQPILAGFFTYIYLRSLKLSVSASLLGSIAFMFCGFMVTWMAYGTMAMAIAFLPLILFCTERIFLKQNGVSNVLLAIAIAVCFFSGHFQISLYVAIFSLAYLIFKFSTTKNAKSFFVALFFYLVGIILCLPQVLPSLQLYSASSRSELFSNAGGIAPQYLVTLFAPDFFGNPVTRNDWFGYYAEWASFIGIIPLTLACVALSDLFDFRGRRAASTGETAPESEKKFILNNNFVFFFFIVSIIALLLALNTPLQKMLSLLKVPVFSTSIPSRIIVLFSFSFSVLAAIGQDALMYAVDRKQIRRILPPLFIMLVILIATWLAVMMHLMPKDKVALAARNLLLPSFLFFVFLGMLLIALFKRHAVVRRGLIWMVLMVAMLDSLRFAGKWMPFDPTEFIFPALPVITAMQKSVGNGRVYGDFGSYIDTYFHLPSIEGYDPLSIQRYGEFLASAKTGTLTEPQRSLATLDRRAKYAGRVLDLLGVTTIYQPNSYINEPWGFPVWEDINRYPVIYQDDHFQLFRNTTALPRATLFYDYEVIPDRRNLLKRFFDDEFDFRNTVLLERDPHIPVCLDVIHRVCEKGEVKIVSYTPDVIALTAETKTPALLFLSDSDYPTWRATVNNKPEQIFRADYAFRGVVVPSGRSVVKFFIGGLF